MSSEPEAHDLVQRGHGAIKGAILGSVSREVVNAYHRPVLLV